MYIAKTRQTLDNQIHTALKNKISFGKSKHADKRENELKFMESTYKIYSYSTYNTYLKECLKFSKWLQTEKGIHKKTDYREAEKYVTEYLQHKLDSGCSIYTIKMQKSALSMLFSKQIDYTLPNRDNKAIKRSRSVAKMDKHYSPTGKYADVFIMALGTGCRRCDLLNLKTDCLRTIDNHLYVVIKGSKGGRDRIAFVREEYAQQVKEIVLNRQIEGHTRVFDKVPTRIDVHALRRQYAKALYLDIKDNKKLKDKLLKNYPSRANYEKNIKRDYYKDRDGNVHDRDAVYIVSQALGHNRLEVTITHYLK